MAFLKVLYLGQFFSSYSLNFSHVWLVDIQHHTNCILMIPNYIVLVVSEISATIHNMEKCICDVKSWMMCNKLQMNNDKMEAILIATQWTSLSHALPPTLNINGIPIEFSKSLRNLGIIFDNSFSLHQNIMNTCKAAYMELRRINSIRNFLSVDATKTLMCSLVLSKLDYCDSLLSGSPQYLIQLFQKVQNTAAQITLRAPKVEHTPPLLHSLHWLPVQ